MMLIIFGFIGGLVAGTIAGYLLGCLAWKEKAPTRKSVTWDEMLEHANQIPADPELADSVDQEIEAKLKAKLKDL